jgi:hypothetical protein
MTLKSFPTTATHLYFAVITGLYEAYPFYREKSASLLRVTDTIVTSSDSNGCSATSIFLSLL